MKFISALVIATAIGMASALADPPPYVDTTCGSWVNDQWVPSSNCVEVLQHGTVTGTITVVKGHLVTVQQATRSVTIDDQPALDSKQTGKVAVGREIVAYGYWKDNNFFATAIY